MNRSTLALGSLLLVAGFGATRFVTFEISQTFDERDIGLKDQSWHVGPQLETPQNTLVRGMPRKIIYAAGWGVCALGAGLAASSLKSRKDEE